MLMLYMSCYPVQCSSTFVVCSNSSKRKTKRHILKWNHSKLANTNSKLPSVRTYAFDLDDVVRWLGVKLDNANSTLQRHLEGLSQTG